MTRLPDLQDQLRAAAGAPVRSSASRLAPALAVAAACLIALLLVVGTGGGPEATTTPAAASASGAPAATAPLTQDGLSIGDPAAPVTLDVALDLQCPVCRALERDTLQTVVRRYVRPGRVRLRLRPVSFIGPDSERAARVLAAAAAGDHAYEAVHALYARQGPENTGWLTDAVLGRVAARVPGLTPAAAVAAADATADVPALDRARRWWTTHGGRGTPELFITHGAGPPAIVGGLPTTARLTRALDLAVAFARLPALPGRRPGPTGG